MPFNTELATLVLERIEQVHAMANAPISIPVDKTWDQTSWRVVRDCGTSMCFAGWAWEMTSGSWLLTPDMLSELRGERPGVVLTAGYYVVLDEASEFHNVLTSERFLQCMGFKDPEGFGALIKRAHGELENLRVMTVDSWAEQALDLGEDSLRMFSANRTLDQLRFIVDFYSTHGTTVQAACRHAEEVRQHMTPFCCTEHMPADWTEDEA